MDQRILNRDEDGGVSRLAMSLAIVPSTTLCRAVGATAGAA
jgi:hypothetical protein